MLSCPPPALQTMAEQIRDLSDTQPEAFQGVAVDLLPLPLDRASAEEVMSAVPRSPASVKAGASKSKERRRLSISAWMVCLVISLNWMSSGCYWAPKQRLVTCRAPSKAQKVSLGHLE